MFAVTLLYPCSSNQRLSCRYFAVTGIVLIKFSLDMLSIANIRTLNGRFCFFFCFSSSTLARRSCRSRITACAFVYKDVPFSVEQFTKINSFVGGNSKVRLKGSHSERLEKVVKIIVSFNAPHLICSSPKFIVCIFVLSRSINFLIATRYIGVGA